MNLKTVILGISAVAVGTACAVHFQLGSSESNPIASQVAGPVHPVAKAHASSAADPAKTRYDQTLTELEQQNPVLNPDSPAFDHEITAAVALRRDSYVRDGMEMSDAIRKAVLDLRTIQAANERASLDAQAQAEQAYYVEQNLRQQQMLSAQDDAFRATERRREEETAVATALAQQQEYTREQQAYYAEQNLRKQQMLLAQDEEYRATKRRREEEAAATTALAQQHNGPPTGSTGAINVVTGEYMAPAGPNLVGTQDGTVYVGAGPNGYVNSRTGEFIPTF